MGPLACHDCPVCILPWVIVFLSDYYVISLNHEVWCAHPALHIANTV